MWRSALVARTVGTFRRSMFPSLLPRQAIIRRAGTAELTALRNRLRNGGFGHWGLFRSGQRVMPRFSRDFALGQTTSRETGRRRWRSMGVIGREARGRACRAGVADRAAFRAPPGQSRSAAGIPRPVCREFRALVGWPCRWPAVPAGDGWRRQIVVRRLTPARPGCYKRCKALDFLPQEGTGGFRWR